MKDKKRFIPMLRVSKSKLALLAVVFAFAACDTSEEQTVAVFEDLVLEDNFDQDGAPDASIWNYDIGTGENGWGNNELQYYTSRSENVSVQNGYLLITARKENFQGSGYTSARLLTKGKFENTYGRYEARIKLPYGQGIWPAFWLLGSDIPGEIWPQIGEIDIMEYRGQEPTVVLGTVHGPGYSAGQSISKRYELQGDRFDTGFHIFGIEWGPEYINFYVDDVLYNQITPEDVPGEWVFNHDFYIILNLAVGGSFVGSPNAETVFPQTMLVDYVRVYESNGQRNF
ncbi:MAG: glycosyl hydrolase family 16 [Leeuwenhoekiella sp.]|uniref:Glycosyl hydrolase family 16 n=1 Tax=Leeuwenhoekiella nanhaiensis TaxID=1655491 RepID=A0A2G1VRH0_9FLAO|nr:glycoside hydrolase family 16 protein [Leeuwenhoekiella nanhaiensis]PHQ29377.1 glycosyl hydrolase family 16 [Leeuwenhoekiella nanhaiensis]PHR97822.1 MAG: glycosyl hydrolase family 16 [Leeuwenhoekiella sp.]